MNKNKVLSTIISLAISTGITCHVEAAELQKPQYIGESMPYLTTKNHNEAMDVLYNNDLILKERIDAIEGINPDEINAALEEKADKAEVDAALEGKADKADLDSKADKAEVDAALEGKADKAEVDAALEGKADKAEVDAALEGKADKTEVDAALEGKADKADLDSKADKAEVDAALEGKADKAEVDAALEEKADKADLDIVKQTADTAKQTADSVKNIADEANNNANLAKDTADTAKDIAIEAKESVANKADKSYVDEENNKQNKEINNNRQAVSQERIDREMADARLNERIDGLSNKMDELDGRVDKVAAIAVAMAGLHPLGYDSEHKTEFSMAAGTYSGETAYAGGIFHHPNEDVLLSIGFSICGSEKAGNIGATFRFGSSGKSNKNDNFDKIEKE